MPSGPSSRASVWARWISAAFAAAYCARGCGFVPEIDAISTAAPPPRARRCGRAARMSTAGWTTLRAIDPLPVGRGRLLEGRSAGRTAGVGDDEVQAAQLARALVDRRGQRRLVGDVGRHAVRADAERAQLAGRALHLIGVARAQPHGAALVGQAQDDRPADPARGARDEGDLARQPEVHQTVGGGVGGGGAGAGGGGGGVGTGGAGGTGCTFGQRCGPGL